MASKKTDKTDKTDKKDKKDKKTDKKRKRKKEVRYPAGLAFASIFAPVFPNHMGTPKTTHDAPYSPPPSDAPPALPAAPPAPESIIPPSHRKVMHEMRMVVGRMEPLNELGPYSGTYAPNAFPDRPNVQPQPSGPGFSPVPIKGSQEYDFGRSPGLGFRTIQGWKIWKAALDIMPDNPAMEVATIIKTAMNRAGVKMGQIDPAEISLLEMGIQWYLSNPGR